MHEDLPVSSPRLLALCCDYDGTLARDGRVDEPTLDALQRLKASGRRLLLVTGRELEDLARVFERIELFDCVVAENGAVLFTPATAEERLLAPAPDDSFVTALKARDLQPLSIGRCIVATWQPHDADVMAVIKELGLELQLVFNKGAVMVLPSGVNKATGLAAALESLHLSPHNAVAVGDGENDHAFLSFCQVSVAVSNAVPALKGMADIVTAGDHGDGVAELIGQLLDDEFACLALQRHRIAVGTLEDAAAVTIDPLRDKLLVSGRSGSGKSTVAHGILERLDEQGYSYCVVDPEGDYLALPGAVVIGDQDHAVTLDAAMQALDASGRVVLNLLGISLEHRPAFLAALAPRLIERRLRTGQPHWVVIDEAHHMLNGASSGTTRLMAEGLDRTLFVTVHPDALPLELLQTLTGVFVVGPGAAAGLREILARSGRSATTAAAERELQPGEALAWLGASPVVQRLKLTPHRAEHRRHTRKYAEGELPEDRCFYFRGPQGRLRLRAQNLMVFLQMGDGVDDETWVHHLHRGDYAIWFSRDIKDDELAQAARHIEAQPGLDAARGRQQMRAAIERLYVLAGHSEPAR